MLVNAMHPALEDAENALDCVGVNDAVCVVADILAAGVLHRPMVSKELIGIAVEAAFVGVKVAFLGDVVGHDLGDGRFVGNRDMERADMPATLD